MSIRIAILTLLVIGLTVYAWRNWFFALCGLILMMAVIEHPDMPKNIGGVQGLNPWNVLMLSILLAWIVQRRSQGLTWDLPRPIGIMMILYLVVIVISVVRMVTDRRYIEQYSTSYLVSEYFINCVKWLIPALLLFDGCRTRRRAYAAAFCILGLYVLLALQVVKYMPLGAAMSGDDVNHVALKICSNEIGYHRVNLSMLLSGASWAMLALLPLARTFWQKVPIVLAFGLVAFAQALTGGRMGYVTWGLLGLVLCVLRWRKMLLLAPVVPVVIALALPGVAERMMQGFGEVDSSGESTINKAEITSDRAIIWPIVINKIMESPVMGHGRLAMMRTGLSAQHEDIGFPHPHNAYLEWLLDNGGVGFMLVMPFYALMLLKSAMLFMDKSNPICGLAGGISLALLLALLIAAMGSQTFYPREGAVGMWAAMALMLRVSLARVPRGAAKTAMGHGQVIPAVCGQPMAGA